MEGYDGPRDGSVWTSKSVFSMEAGECQSLPHGYTFEECSLSFEKPNLVDDIDVLIGELESHNGHMDEEQDTDDRSSSCHHVPLEHLQTNTRTGLTDAEVASRRKRYGLNQMRKEETKHPIVVFLMFFVGPIQFVMEVSRKRRPYDMYLANHVVASRLLQF